MKNEKLIITPKTKVLNLIETYPKLEDILISYVPAFKKLKSPILRNTVAKIASLQQAAIVGKVNVSDLINILRKEVGQDFFNQSSEKNIYNFTEPNWYDQKLITQTFNAKEMLENGEQPVNQVITDLKKLNKNTIYQLIAPFLPAPLIEKSLSLKISHWIVEEKKELFNIYFYKE
ncbi:MAG: hypothetical protein COB02_16255 [Candidatus Cloacimonadota bacterium]|nr:MAG: hypothetical protein COB02_16255 [Candidatus Cloacimonadota bacterium]